MPYVIETNRYLDDPAAEFAPGALPAVQHHAVATLAEARDYLQPIVREAASPRVRSALVSQVASLGEAGGLIGPLPDGTTIRVKHVTYPELSGPEGIYWPTEGLATDIMDAFNAQHV